MELSESGTVLFVAFVPLLFIAIVGFYIKNNPPKKINQLYGYRTKRSMKSKEAWDFSQIYSADLLYTWSIAGMIGLALQIWLTPVNDVMSVTITSTMVLVLICGGAMYFTEKELKDKF